MSRDRVIRSALWAAVLLNVFGGVYEGSGQLCARRTLTTHIARGDRR